MEPVGLDLAMEPDNSAWPHWPPQRLSSVSARTVQGLWEPHWLPGIMAPGALTFKAIEESADRWPPELLHTDPPDEGTNLSATAPLILVFSENMRLGDGSITVTPEHGPAIAFEGNSSEVKLDGRVITLTPRRGGIAGSPGSWPAGRLVVTISVSALYDTSGNPFVGLPRGWLEFHVAGRRAAEPVQFSVDRPPPAEIAADPGPVSSLRVLSEGQGVHSFCVAGPPFALANFVHELRYQSASDWVGQEPLRLAVSDPRDPRQVHAASTTWLHVEDLDDRPTITASIDHFIVRTGDLVQLDGIDLYDADAMQDGTKWMTLWVSATTGRLFLDEAYTVAPGENLHLLAGRLDGDKSLRVEGSLAGLRSFLRALRFGPVAPAKPYLNLRPLCAPTTDATVSYVFSTGGDPGVKALTHFQVAGTVMDPMWGEVVPDVQVEISSSGRWHEFSSQGVTLQGCTTVQRATVQECKDATRASDRAGFVYDHSALLCCLKASNVSMLLSNLYENITLTTHVFYGADFFIRLQTSANGTYTALLPSGLATISIFKFDFMRQTKQVDVDANIQLGGPFDMFIRPRLVKVVWRIELSWSPTRSPRSSRESVEGRLVDLDSHLLDAWGCHAYFAHRRCAHNQDDGLYVTLNRDDRGADEGSEVMTIMSWPCTPVTSSSRYTDVRGCQANYWIHMFSEHAFADVDAEVRVYRQNVQVLQATIPQSEDPAAQSWVGIVFDWEASTASLAQNQVGEAGVVEGLLGGQELFPGRALRDERGAPHAKRLAPWVEAAIKGMRLPKGSAAEDWGGPLARRLASVGDSDSYVGLATTDELTNLTDFGLFFTPAADGRSYNVCHVDLQDIPGSLAASPWAHRATLGDDDSVKVPLEGGFAFYGQTYWSVHLSSNGFLLFGGPPAPGWQAGRESHLRRVGISALASDLAPHRAGSVWWEYRDGAGDPQTVFTFQGVPRLGDDAGNTFQVSLFARTGVIRLSWAAIAPDTAANAVVGVSPGLFGMTIEDIDLENATSCTSECGDGRRELLEECDDGGVAGGDGCSEKCSVEPGYSCAVQASLGQDVCALAVCGDGWREGSEECDDHNTRAGDGCSADCRVETGYSCSWRPRHSDLCAGPGPAPAEAFGYAAGDGFDLQQRVLTFTPVSTGYVSYSFCRGVLDVNTSDADANTLLDPPSPRAQRLPLQDDFDDSSFEVSLATPFTFYGVSYSVMHIASNGYVTFDGPDVTHGGGLAAHFERLRISALLTDLAPQSGGVVLYEVVEDGTETRAVVTWDGVPEFGTLDPNRFQMALYLADGRIRLSWAEVAAVKAVVGLSNGFRPASKTLRLDAGGALRVQPAALPTNFYSGDFTWELFYKMEAAPGSTSAIISNTASGDPSSQVRVDLDAQGRLVVLLRHGDPSNQESAGGTSVATLPLGELGSWVHLALVVARNVACSAADVVGNGCTYAVLYINGQRSEEWRLPETYGSPGQTMYDSGQGLVLAQCPQGDCGLAGVRIYSRALAAAELGSCRYGRDVNVSGLVFSADMDGSLIELAAGSLVEVTGTMRFVEDTPAGCAARAEPFNRDLSNCAACAGVCGNGLREATEGCDDGVAADGSGCSSACVVESGFVCRGGSATSADTCKVIECGDGVAEGPEECDDGNAHSGDGCSSTCLVEHGYTCSGAGSGSCLATCGDGQREGSEACDDGNVLAGDGCSATCAVEPGFVCRGGNPQRHDICHAVCGDGVRAGSEACDDGNAQDGDGCSPHCVVEPGFVCHGGNPNASDVCSAVVCGDGVLEGAEECDDYNRFSGDGCSALCLIEHTVPAESSEVAVSVAVFPQTQVCRIANSAQHETLEDHVYHLQHTILTGDVVSPERVTVSVTVRNGAVTMWPLLERYRAEGKADARSEALVRRETGISFEDYSETMSEAVLFGTAEDVDHFLRYSLYIDPQFDFNGYMQVDFEVLSGLHMGVGGGRCAESILLRALAVFDDKPVVSLSPELEELGVSCTSGGNGCPVPGFLVYDGDCAQVPDGSCYLRLSVFAERGTLTIPGSSPEPARESPQLFGHYPGLNAALAKLRYRPPEFAPLDGKDRIHVQLARIVDPTLATPVTVVEMFAENSVVIEVPQDDTPPTLVLEGGAAFHSSVFRVQGPKPFVMRNIIFWAPGATTFFDSNESILVVLNVSRGHLFLGTIEGSRFENDTSQGQPRLQFRAPANLLRERYT